MNWLVVVVLILVPLWAICWRRNNQVYAYRSSLLDQLRAQCYNDILAERYEVCGQRFAGFDEVSYDRMMWQWWRPLDSFGLRERCLFVRLDNHN